MKITTKENANGKISGYFVDGQKVRKCEVESLACNTDAVVEIDYYTAKQFPLIEKPRKEMKVVFTGYYGGQILMTEAAANELGATIGRGQGYNVYYVDMDTVKIDNAPATDEVKADEVTTVEVETPAVVETTDTEPNSVDAAEHVADKVARESKPIDDNDEVFNLLPSVDELNDVEIEEPKFDGETDHKNAEVILQVGDSTGNIKYRYFDTADNARAAHIKICRAAGNRYGTGELIDHSIGYYGKAKNYETIFGYVDNTIMPKIAEAVYKAINANAKANSDATPAPAELETIDGSDKIAVDPLAELDPAEYAISEDAFNASVKAEIEIAAENHISEQFKAAREFADKLIRIDRLSEEQADAVITATFDGKHDTAAVKKLIDDFKNANFNEAQKVAVLIEKTIADEVKAAVKAEIKAAEIANATVAEPEAATVEEKADKVTVEAAIETKIASNGNINVYINGKRVSNKVAVEFAEQNSLPTYRATCLTYAGNFIDNTAATAIAAFKWLANKSNQNRNVADGSSEIIRQKDGQADVIIYKADEQDVVISEDEPELEIFYCKHCNLPLDTFKRSREKAALKAWQEIFKACAIKKGALEASIQAHIELYDEDYKIINEHYVTEGAFFSAYMNEIMQAYENEFNTVDEVKAEVTTSEVETPATVAEPNSNAETLAPETDDDETVFSLLPSVAELNEVDGEFAEPEDDEPTQPDEANNAPATSAPDINHEPEKETISMTNETFNNEPAEFIAQDGTTYRVLADNVRVTSSGNCVLINGAKVAEYPDAKTAIAAAKYVQDFHDNIGSPTSLPFKTFNPDDFDTMFDDYDRTPQVNRVVIINNEPPEFNFRVARFGAIEKPDDRIIRLAEDVAASMSQAAPDGWAVSFNNLENEFKITYAGSAIDSVDTITVGDFNNPKEFFAQFLTPEEANEETKKLAELRREIRKNFPDQTERLKMIDNMINEVRRTQNLRVFEDDFNRNPSF